MSSIQLNSKQHINNFKLKLEVSEELEGDRKICSTPAKRHIQGNRLVAGIS